MSPQTTVQILRCLILGRYTATVQDGELRIRGPQPLAGPLPASIKARRDELIAFLLDWCGGEWPPAKGSGLQEVEEFLECDLATALNVLEAVENGREPFEGLALTEARRRAEELPTLVWSATLHRLGVQIEYHEARAEEVKAAQHRASAEAEKLEKKRFELQERMEVFTETVHAENNDWRDHKIHGKQARRERAALEHSGPDFGLLKRARQ